MYKQQKVAVILPMLNEAPGIDSVLQALLALGNERDETLVDDIIVCDNGSDDGSPLIAQAAGARVVYESQKGYGAACSKAISALRSPDIVVFVDADRSVKVSEIHLLLDKLVSLNGDAYDLVIGSRTLGTCEKYSLTPAQRVGNHLASHLIQWRWRHPVSDLGPFRAIKYHQLLLLHMQDRRYGWTVEMQVKAIQQGLRVCEVPVSNLRRAGKSKISGTLLGTLGAGAGIIGMIWKLHRQFCSKNSIFSQAKPPRATAAKSQ
ncbi:MAG: glycosyltransferase family 2 protein [Pseudomonadales bacterium]